TFLEVAGRADGMMLAVGAEEDGPGPPGQRLWVAAGQVPVVTATPQVHARVQVLDRLADEGRRRHTLPPAWVVVADRKREVAEGGSRERLRSDVCDLAAKVSAHLLGKKRPAQGRIAMGSTSIRNSGRSSLGTTSPVDAGKGARRWRERTSATFR